MDEFVSLDFSVVLFRVGCRAVVRLAKNTEADKPIFLRKHLLEVHDVSVATLKDNGDKKLVSLVGCPGTGKTWCGWLVANTLQCKHKVQVLHLTIRGTDVIAIWASDDGQYQKSTYKKVDVWTVTSSMLGQVLTDSKCQVCIIDVGDLLPDEVKKIFRGVHRILEDDSNVIKFMGLVSGHGEEDIVGNQFNIQQKAHTLVLWSWSEKEFEAFHDKFNSFSKENKTGHELDKNIYRICGGSVRGCFQPDGAQAEIFRTVKMLSQDEKDNFLIVNTRPTSSAEQKQRSHLLAFFPAKVDSDFKHGVAHANQVPRSDYVIQCIRADTQSSPKRVKEMYDMLSDYNPGAAGTAFEMLVHFFWKHVVETELDVKLTLDWRHDDKPTQSIEVKGGELQGYNSQAIEENDNEKKIAAGGLTGYFTPKDFKYPVLDSLLRYKHGDAVMVLAIQISIAKTHQHGELVQNTLLKEEAEGEPKPKLALWDFKAKGKQCKWTPTTSDHWDLMYVECEAFTQWFEQI